MTAGPAVAVVIVTYDSADAIMRTLGALEEQLRPDDELVVVDNGSSDGTPALVRAGAPRAQVLETESNRGFAGGTRVGAAATGNPLLIFLNPDCVPAPGFVDALRTCAAEHPSWGAWQGLVTMDEGRSVNTAGNVVHFLGIGWAGGLGEPVGSVAWDPREVPFASGAALAVRRAAWDAVGGFEERYFMYVEDLDLSLRLRLAGWGVGVVPAARADHDYTFVKGDYKWFFLERNRWWTLLGVYPLPLLVAVAPALAAFELALLVVAARQGWLAAKLRSQAAVVRELPAILRRRRAIQARRAIGASTFAAALAAHLDSPILQGAAALPGLEQALRLYFAVARRVVSVVDRVRPLTTA